MESIINFITGEIFNNAVLVFGFVALLGLLLQGKKADEVFTGTLRTMLGYLILIAGVGILFSNINPATLILRHGFAGQYEEAYLAKVAEGQSADFFAQYGAQIGLVMVGAFFVNLIIARITPMKIVWMTMNLLLQNTWFVLAILIMVTPWSMPVIVAVAILFLGFWHTFIPWVTLPWSRKVIDGDDFTLGHACHTSVILTAWLGKYIGKKDDSTEDIKLPEGLGFFSDPIIMTTIIFLFIYLVGTIAAGPAWVRDNYAGGKNPWIWMIISALTGATGMAVLLQGVKMLLTELTAAFKGIATKLVPGAVPALDMPVFFGYAPNALMIGFITHMIAGTIIMFIVAAVAPEYTVFPAIVPAFFEGGTAGIFGNATGGKRGAILGGVLSALLCYVLLIPLLPIVTPMADYARQFPLSDYTGIFNILGHLLKFVTGGA